MYGLLITFHDWFNIATGWVFSACAVMAEIIEAEVTGSEAI